MIESGGETIKKNAGAVMAGQEMEARRLAGFRMRGREELWGGQDDQESEGRNYRKERGSRCV